MFTKQVVRDQILSGSVMGILHSWKAEAGAGSGVRGTGTTLWRKQHFQTQLLLSGVPTISQVSATRLFNNTEDLAYAYF